MFESIVCQVTDYDADVLEALIERTVEIAREGREGGASARCSRSETSEPCWQTPAR